MLKNVRLFKMKKLFDDFTIGVGAYWKAIIFIFKNNLWYYFFFPVIINLLLFFIGISFVNNATDFSIEWVESQLNDSTSTGILGMLFQWTKDSFSWIIWIMFKLLFLYIFILFGGYFSLIVLSPILTYLSEKTEEIITGRKNPFDVIQLTRDVIRAIVIVIRNMCIQIVWIIIFFILSFIPIVGWVVSFFGNIIVSSYFYGFSFMDYTNERNKFSISESVSNIRENKGLSIGLGFVFLICFSIPLIGSIVASIASIISVVAATISMIDYSESNYFIKKELN